MAVATSTLVALPSWPRMCALLCGSTTSIGSPVAICSWPAMVMVSSVRWPASSLILLSSTARSWLPGWYCLTGSLTGTGVLVTASMLLIVGASRGEISELLGRVPAELVAFGAVHGEPGVLVARVGGGQRLHRAAHVGARVRRVHVRGGQVLELDGLFYDRPCRLAVAGVWIDVL